MASYEDSRRDRWTDERLDEEFRRVRADLDVLKESHMKLSHSLQDGFAEARVKQQRILLLLQQTVGENGEPEQGRLGRLEVLVEALNKFKWQALAIISAVIVGIDIAHFWIK